MSLLETKYSSQCYTYNTSGTVVVLMDLQASVGTNCFLRCIIVIFLLCVMYCCACYYVLNDVKCQREMYI